MYHFIKRRMFGIISTCIISLQENVWDNKYMYHFIKRRMFGIISTCIISFKGECLG